MGIKEMMRHATDRVEDAIGSAVQARELLRIAHCSTSQANTAVEALTQLLRDIEAIREKEE